MQEDAFKKYLTAQNLAANTLSTRCSALKRIERDESVDLDSEYEKDGLLSLISRFKYDVLDKRQGRLNPSKIEIEPENLSKFLAFYKSTINSYIRFKAGFSEGEATQTELVDVSDELDAEIEIAGRTFALERDLQAALRSDITQLEPGLTVVDGGQEAKVEAGRIDILAKDAEGRWTVIELKAEIGRPAVIAQTLAYMASILEKHGGDVRGIIVAADFDPRVELAAKAVPNLLLKRYSFRFDFDNEIAAHRDLDEAL